jgi:hypothetical protein
VVTGLAQVARTAAEVLYREAQEVLVEDVVEEQTTRDQVMKVRAMKAGEVEQLAKEEGQAPGQPAQKTC